MNDAANVGSLTEEELKRLGAALFSLPLFKIWCVLEGANVARDAKEPGELFQDPYSDHHFTSLVEDVGNRVEATAPPREIPTKVGLLPALSARIADQLEAEARQQKQMR